MKYNKRELDVDFIGGQKPLTKEEAKAISEYLREVKAKRDKIRAKRRTHFVTGHSGVIS